jgi:uroporphyrinogen decarboxylase
MKMNSRERIRAIAERKKTDRPGSSLRATPEAWESLRNYFGVDSNQEVMDILDIDIRFVSLPYAGPKDRNPAPLGSEGIDIWGCRTKKVTNEFNSYFDFDYHPLKEAETVEDIAGHEWPDLDWWDYNALPGIIQELHRTDERAVLYFAGGMFETPWYIRGMEPFLMDLYANPEMVDEICRRVGDYYTGRLERVLEAAGDMIDIIGSGGDIGTQRGMMIDPEIWRKEIKQHTARLITPYKERGFITFYHSCGSIVPVIDDFIEMKLDLLEPVQVSAAGMDPKSLADKFSARISFHGGIDEQEVLPHGTPAEVYENTLSTIDQLGRYNGYIAAPCHQAQNDTPPANIEALFKAVKDYPNRR